MIWQMQVVKVTTYMDRGVARRSIHWQDGNVKGVADSHCSVTGKPLGDTDRYCAWHCRKHGHFSTMVSHLLDQYARHEISEPEMLAVFRMWSVFED